MSAFLVRQNLSRGDLALHLSNEQGYAQDAASVFWTVYTVEGQPISGSRIPAIRKGVGSYYAPWNTDVANGAYNIRWEILSEFGESPFFRVENFFVVDPSSYVCGRPINEAAVPPPGSSTFLSGQPLGPQDLPIFLKNDAGFSTDAYAVFWTILDSRGCSISPRTIATRFNTGSYYAQWQVTCSSGNYVVYWEYQADQNGPLESARIGFSVITPSTPIVVYVRRAEHTIDRNPPPPQIIPAAIIGGGGGGDYDFDRDRFPPGARFYPPPPPPMPPAPVYPPAPPECSSSFEVPRTIHLPFGPLLPSGQYTDQVAYIIPQHIRTIAFYVTYKRGAPGGYPGLMLLWGNGTDEAPETLLDVDLTVVNDTSVQNMFLQELDGPAPPDNNPVTFIVEASVPGGARTVRLIASEKGSPGAPGSIGITLTAATN